MEKLIIAQVNVQKKNVVQFIEYAKVMVEKSNQEKGCITYRLLTEIDKPNEFIIYEKYIDEKAVDLHNESEHLADFFKAVSNLLVNKPIIDLY